MNDLVSLQKDSGSSPSSASSTRFARRRSRTSLDYNFTPPYVVAGALFVCLTVPMARVTDWLARRQGVSAGESGDRETMPTGRDVAPS